MLIKQEINETEYLHTCDSVCHLSSERHGYIFIVNVWEKNLKGGKKLCWNNNEEVVVLSDILFLNGQKDQCTCLQLMN